MFRYAERPGARQVAEGGAGTLAGGRRGADTGLVGRLIATAIAAVVCAAIFVVVRNHLDLEDSRFINALLVCSTLAFALSMASSALRRGSMRSSVALGVAGFLLVPLLYVAYLVIFAVSVCIVGGQTCYS